MAAEAVAAENGGKRRAPKAEVEPEPLSAERVYEISSFLEAAGGAVVLGKVSTTFPGVKKASLGLHFALLEDSRGEPIVTLSGELPEGFDSTPVEQPKRKRRNTVPPWFLEPLGEAVVQEITGHLEANGGSLLLGKLTQMVIGLKKAQLEPFFEIWQPPNLQGGSLVVSLPGCRSMPPSGGSIPPIPTKTDPLGTGREIVGAGAGARGAIGAGGTFAPALEEGLLRRIEEFLRLQGGSALMGKLSAQFERLKKAQLVPYFGISQAENGDLVISLPPQTHLSSSRPLPTVLAPQRHQRSSPSSLASVEASQSRSGVADVLDGELVRRITGFLQEQGGASSLGKVSTVFPGVKKAHLAVHFQLIAKGSDFLVSSFGTAPQVVKQVVKRQLAASLQTARTARKATPEAEVQALDLGVVQQIAEHLAEHGGSEVMSRLVSKFSGVRKVQLAAHFNLEKMDSLNGDYMVTV